MLFQELNPHQPVQSAFTTQIRTCPVGAYKLELKRQLERELIRRFDPDT